MHALVRRLYPLCRSITGDGLRRTLEIIGESAPLRLTEVPTGTKVLDWTIPREWNIRDASIKDPSGGPGWSTSRSRTCTWWATACPSTPRSAWTSSADTCTRCPTSRIWCRTGPATTPRRGASA
ncbi:DUF4910 domain-containing protein [Nonomuraea salmonea]|uniref:DUF4910 domain-containing protein n=1 Tax=Nonomuraea salmonea TaxID=46181 RepID=UPI003CD054F7